MEQIELQATAREVRGKKVRFLRSQGKVPVHVFGHNVESLALQCDTVQLQNVLPQAGKTGIISLKVDTGSEPRNVMVREIQRDPLSGKLLHVDFYQVSMTEKIKTTVPVVLVGQAPAMKEKENLLVQELNHLTVECLPGQLPSSVELDVSSLVEAHQEIRIRNIRLNDRICVINEPDAVIVRIGVQRAEKVEEVVVAAPTEVAEGEAAAEGAPSEEKAEAKE